MGGRGRGRWWWWGVSFCETIGVRVRLVVGELLAMCCTDRNEAIRSAKYVDRAVMIAVCRFHICKPQVRVMSEL